MDYEVDSLNFKIEPQPFESAFFTNQYASFMDCWLIHFPYYEKIIKRIFEKQNIFKKKELVN